ncbi:OmpA family protein [Archangium violaceum]|uniref:OmpA family protein n=1 Tax=Archangium violaceum TaxID=83451 RepID=UPI0036D8A6F0
MVGYSTHPGAPTSSPGLDQTYEAHSPSTLGNTWMDARNLRHGSTATGGVGLLRLAGADLGRKGVLRFSATGEFFSTPDFPVQGAINTRTGGTFAVGYVPLDYLDLSLSYTASTNTNTRSSPNLIQALGDVTLGARATKQWLPGLWAGADVRVMTFSGVGSNQIAFGFSPRAVATYDARSLSPMLPLRLHANLGLLLDGTGSLVDAGRLNAAEEYALGINRYSRLGVGFGLEVPLPVVTPFLEYGLTSPLGVPDGQLVAPDGSLVPVGSVAPQTLGLGLKVTAVQNLTFTAAAELGLTRMVGRGVQPVPPFNLVLGASFNVDPALQAGGTRVIERVVVREPTPVEQTPPTLVERTTPTPVRTETPQVAQAPQVAQVTTAQVSGVVVDAKTRQPLSGVLVALVDSTLPPVASAPGDGRFLTYALPSGPVKLSVRKDGYLPLEKTLVLEAGKTASVEMELVAEVKPVAFALAVTARRKPVPATLVFFGGPTPRQVKYSQADAESRQLQLPAGRYVVEVTAAGFLAQTRTVEAANGASVDLSFDLEPEPKQWQVKRENDKLELLQPVRFADGKAVLLPDSHALLAQVVALMVRTGVQRIRIEGHTDNQGDKTANLNLSKERARAVADYLIKAGLDPSRIESEGFGDSRPVAPNMTPKGRELNRRVDFVILDR